MVEPWWRRKLRHVMRAFNLPYSAACAVLGHFSTEYNLEGDPAPTVCFWCSARLDDN